MRPEDVGLPGRGLRRTPGLRREEVATLAGIGVSWYTWLEQGRSIKVSESVVASISRVLRLDDAERAYFYHLAGLNPPAALDAPGAPPLPELERVLEAWSPYPAYVLDRWWNYVLTNSSAQAVFGLPRSGRNCLALFFTNPAYRSFFTNWNTLAPQVVARFRSATASFPDDDRFTVLQRADCTSGARTSRRCGTSTRSVRSRPASRPMLIRCWGEMTFDHFVLHPSSRHDLRVTVHLPRSGEAVPRLERLLAAQPHQSCG